MTKSTKYLLATSIALLVYGSDCNLGCSRAEAKKNNLEFIVDEGKVIDDTKECSFDRSNVEKYKNWIKETIQYSEKKQASAIIVDKKDRELRLYNKGKLVKTFPVELGFNPCEDKKMEGDGATPEGKYKIKRVRGKGQTVFYRALLIDYPKKQDWKEFRALKRKGKVPRHVKSPGSAIEIHGGNPRGGDWTAGCMALFNKQMDELFQYVKKGTPVTIVKYDEK